VVDESGTVENFHNGSELTCELKIRRNQLSDRRSNRARILINFTSIASQILSSVASVIGRHAPNCEIRVPPKPLPIL
jgi:hypothetical protein